MVSCILENRRCHMLFAIYACPCTGERRRVQLVMGLMAEWELLLLDEVGSHQLDPVP